MLIQKQWQINFNYNFYTLNHFNEQCQKQVLNDFLNSSQPFRQLIFNFIHFKCFNCIFRISNIIKKVKNIEKKLFDKLRNLHIMTLISHHIWSTS